MHEIETVFFELKNLGTALRKNRERVATIILEKPTLFPALLKLVFYKDEKIATKAAWVLEIVLAKNLTLIAPHLSYFTSNLASIKNDSAARCCAKTCEFIATAYDVDKNTFFKEKLSNKHINNIIEVCFDWLITPHKVAVKVFCMSTLYIFGKNKSWIHYELTLILQQNTAYESAAYKARSKNILALINKYNC